MYSFLTLILQLSHSSTSYLLFAAIVPGSTGCCVYLSCPRIDSAYPPFGLKLEDWQGPGLPQELSTDETWRLCQLLAGGSIGLGA